MSFLVKNPFLPHKSILLVDKKDSLIVREFEKELIEGRPLEMNKKFYCHFKGDRNTFEGK